LLQSGRDDVEGVVFEAGDRLGEEGEELNLSGREPVDIHQRVAHPPHVLAEDGKVDQKRGGRGRAVRVGGDPGDARGVGLPLGTRLVGGQILLPEPDVRGEVEQERYGEGFTGGEVAEEMAAVRAVPAGGHLREAVQVAVSDAVLLGDDGGDLLDRNPAGLHVRHELGIADLILDAREVGADLAHQPACLLPGGRHAMGSAAHVEIAALGRQAGSGRQAQAHQDQGHRNDVAPCLELHGLPPNSRGQRDHNHLCPVGRLGDHLTEGWALFQGNSDLAYSLGEELKHDAAIRSQGACPGPFDAGRVERRTDRCFSRG